LQDEIAAPRNETNGEPSTKPATDLPELPQVTIQRANSGAVASHNSDAVWVVDTKILGNELAGRAHGVPDFYALSQLVGELAVQGLVAMVDVGKSPGTVVVRCREPKPHGGVESDEVVPTKLPSTGKETNFGGGER
jgi:hypothetical protein